MNSTKKRVLIIDDSTDDIQFVMENLKDEYAVLVATNGQKGIELAEKDPKPEVILLDVMMPEMDGYETCRKLKENPTTSDIDVIFVSAHDTTEEKLAGYDAGGSDYLIKPVQPKELLQKVKLAIDNSDSRAAHANEKQEAIQTAMLAMTSAGEQGVVLEFLRHSSAVTSLEDLASMIVSSVAQYDIENTVQIRTESKVINHGTKLPVPPLEEELLLRLKDQDRIMEFNNRTVFNFGAVSLLIKNMPDDDDKRGRLRDHLAILMEGAETKVTALEMEQKISQLVIDSQNTLDSIESRQRQHKLAGQEIMDTMLQKLEESFLPWGLTEDQEATLMNVVETGVNQSLQHVESGFELDEEMSEIFNRLQSLSNKAQSN